jgi:transcription-repair coupling factor (superfamily II helicase)
VGLDLYSKIVNDIIRERNLLSEQDSSPGLPREEVAILNVFKGARIPDTYIQDPHLRLNLYRRLAVMTNEDDLEAFHKEILDRFGRLPDEVEELIKGCRLSILAARLGIRAVRAGEDRIHVDFRSPASPARLLEEIRRHMEQQRIDYRFQNLRTSEDLRLTFSPVGGDTYSLVSSLMRSLLR